MPDENGLSLLERLRQHNPRFKAIILSIYDSASFVKKPWMQERKVIFQNVVAQAS